MSKQFTNGLLLTLCLSLFLITVGLGRQKLTDYHKSFGESESAEREVLYLPNGTALELLSFAYRNALANILWFNTINYFGKHYATDQSYRWLFHMCDLVTTLDPRADHVFRFGGVILSWEGKVPEKSIELLTKAIRHFPEDWEFYYQRGFTYMYFLDDADRAREDFVRAAQLPNAHSVVVRLAAKKSLAMGDPDTALDFLGEAIRTASDDVTKGALLRRYREAQLESDIAKLNQALRLFEERAGEKAESLQSLVDAGIIPGLPKDPFGGEYYLEVEPSRMIRSTSPYGQKLTNTTAKDKD